MSPMPRQLARLNRVGLNRLTVRVFPRLPGFGVVVHSGRRSGRNYRTPVWVFRTARGYVVALAYGPDCDWVRNVLAAGAAALHTGGRIVQVDDPRLFHDTSRAEIRVPERWILRLIGVNDFLELGPVT